VRTPIEQTVRALDDLQQQGKTLYPAVSNWAAWQIAIALGVSAREGLARFELIQRMYNLVRRQAEIEILPLAAGEKLGGITYSPSVAACLPANMAWFRSPGGRTRPFVLILDIAARRGRRPGCARLRVGHRGESSPTGVAPRIVPRRRTPPNRALTRTERRVGPLVTRLRPVK
jgi:diketogulonate reductase-like aldo/keto reductase